MTDKRLIEVAFPLKQTSLDSVHEKNVRHGHISTLHIWPARRPLAASRAALIATLLPDPGDAEKRREILRRMAGTVVEKIEKKKIRGKTVEVRKEETMGGILHWGRESGPDLDWFRQEIRKAYGGRAPKVLDPFAGGGAIPLEAMRLGCEVTAVDINPVAWFILKCTLEYPQKLAGQTLPLPEFARRDRDFMEAFLKAKGFKGALLRTQLERLGLADAVHTTLAGIDTTDPTLQADLAWQVRAWGHWVLNEARKKLVRYYPTYAHFEPLKEGKPYEPQPMRLLEVDANGVPLLDELNANFDAAYLKDLRNPRWIAKPTVAYLWARTVTCKNCRATLPLLKTRWLAKKDNKRVLLTMEPNADRTGVVFGAQDGVPQVNGNAARRREHDKRIGAGTMSRSGAKCPCCGTIMTTEYIRLEGRAGRLGAVMTAVVVGGLNGKEYRLPTTHEIAMAQAAEADLEEVFQEVPVGLPEEPTPKGGSGAARAFSVDGYGFDQWRKLFTARQLVVLGSFSLLTQKVSSETAKFSYPTEWHIVLTSYLALVVDRIADRSSTICHWDIGYEKVANTFTGYRLPISWDFTETNTASESTGSYSGQLEWIARYIEHAILGVCPTYPIPVSTILGPVRTHSSRGI
jgi:adenine-specific DNA methylase